MSNPKGLSSGVNFSLYESLPQDGKLRRLSADDVTPLSEVAERAREAGMVSWVDDPDASKQRIDKLASNANQRELARLQAKRKGELLSIAIFLPIRLLSEMNTSEHWTKYAARNKAQQEEVKVEWYRLTRNAVIGFPCAVRFTRIGQKRLDPGNLESCFKHVQDSICACLGVDDGDTGRIRFEYDQEATGKREYGVRIEVRKV